MISNAIERAYNIAKKRDYDTLYWMIDLHGTCLKSNYISGNYEFINDDVLIGLQAIQDQDSSCIIIWSSCHEAAKAPILSFLNEHGIFPDYFNENLEIEDTATGAFGEKFYFNIGIDDKFGFDADTDWMEVVHTLNYIDDEYI